jgi:hypothetical protein
LPGCSFRAGSSKAKKEGWEKRPNKKIIVGCKYRFTQRFFPGKVVFDMSRADEYMFPPFTYLFHDSFLDLCDSSAIMRLKAVPVTTRQPTYYHTLDTK